MSDAPNGKHLSRGEQAHKWIMTAGTGVILFLSLRLIADIDKMAAKVESLQIQVTTLAGTTEGRINAHAERLTTLDRQNQDQTNAIGDLQRRVWALPGIGGRQ